MTNIANTTPAGRQKYLSQIRIDMTPMVDLGFLLITFFVFTASMSDTNAMKLHMPADGSSNVSEENVLTVLISGGRTIFTYEGDWKGANASGKIKSTGYGQSGIGKLISDKKTRMLHRDPADKLMVLIKPLEDAEYRNLVNILDEMLIYEAPSYAIVDPTEEERFFVKTRLSGKREIRGPSVRIRAFAN